MLASNDKCFGCSACFDICPMNAITMSIDTGFYRPVVDNNKCVGCKLCEKVCGALDDYEIETKKNTPIKCYASWSNNSNLHFESSSGGIATELSLSFVRNGGFVIGAFFDLESGLVHHEVAISEEDVKRFAKSKYVQSDKRYIYNKLKHLIKTRDCLFIGVPCEVNAVKKYYELITGEKKRLFSIDLLCRGGNSPRALYDHINNLKKERKVTNVSFRGGKYDCKFTLYGENNKILYQGEQFQDPYFRFFMEHILLQPVCYECPFTGINRLGDLTLGDFWGLDKNVSKLTKIQGKSMVFINNNYGVQLFNLINDCVTSIERPVSEAVSGNETLQSPTPHHKDYDLVWTDYLQNGFETAYENYYKEKYYKVCKKQLYKFKLRFFYKIIRVFLKPVKKILKNK